jgi:LysR family glycine cleavage system transcriptional activator
MSKSNINLLKYNGFLEVDAALGSRGLIARPNRMPGPTPYPPFSGLRLLEAACRHQSYTQAGHEMGVSHSAVSQAMSRLERAYGVQLFRRRGSRVEPTTAAEQLARSYQDALRAIEEAGLNVARAAAPTSFVISTLPSIARLWLGARVANLRRVMPDDVLELRTSRELANLDADGVDVAVRFGLGRWPGLHAELLFDEVAFPVVSPALAATVGAGEDLASLPKIMETPDLWPAWCAAAGAPPPEPRGLIYDDAAMVVDAALAGQGVALMRRLHASDLLAAGKLVRLSEVAIRTPFSCYLVWRPDHPRLRLVHAVLDWLLGECDVSGLLELTAGEPVDPPSRRVIGG